MEHPTDVPKIMYASRAHSQLTQVIKEMKGTKYNKMKMAVLGSREQLCIHPDLTNENRIRKCESKIRTKITDGNGQKRCGCSFYDGVKEATSMFSEKILDIKDLVTEGKQNTFCPYYMSSELAKDADIIFIPYNYILDPKSRGYYYNSG